jgi:hypothetical protein
MSARRHAITNLAARWRPTLPIALLALTGATLACAWPSAGAAGAATSTITSTSTPSTGPSLGSISARVQRELQRGKLNRLGSATTTSPSLGATRSAATGSTTGSAVPPSATTLPPSSTTLPGAASTAPARPSLLGGSALNRTNTTAAKQRPAKSGISTLAVVIAVLGALLVLACAAWALARGRAYEPHWWLSLQHSLAEAGYRTSSTWSEFSDWARRGG